MRRDAQIKEDVLSALKWSTQVREEHIGVTVHNGAVTLTGHVPTYWHKRAAKEAAKSVTAVKALVDNIEVRLDNEMRTADEALANRLANLLEWNVANVGHGVKAEVKNGTVTLTGEVEWHSERESIQRSVEHVAGVVNLIDLITVKPRVSKNDVNKQIREALERHAEIEASNISVEIANGIVTLAGTGESLAELDRIEAAAWNAPGVVKIINNARVVNS